MSARAPRFEPVAMTWQEVAATYFRRSETWLRSNIHKLEDFPRPDPKLRLFAREQIDAWWRKRFGIATPAVANDTGVDWARELEERLGGAD